MECVSLEKAVALIPDGASIMVGGFMGIGTPEQLMDELVRQGKRNLTLICNDNALPGVGVGKLVTDVHEGDRVRAGDRLTEGPVNPHDILRIKGPRAVQEYLLNEVQEVYRLQGVKINDKHIGVIVRQMLQKVRVTDAGDTDMLEGENVDRTAFREVNQKAIVENRYWFDDGLKIVDAVAGVAERIGKTPSQVALSWLFGDARVTAAIVGARRVEQLSENLVAGDFDLPAEVRDELTNAVPFRLGYPHEWTALNGTPSLDKGEAHPKHTVRMP